MTFNDTFKQYFKKLPPFDPKRVIDFDPSTDPIHQAEQYYNSNFKQWDHMASRSLITPGIETSEDSDDIPSEFTKIMQQDLNKFIMTTWEGKVLNSDEKK